jgi:hypothetical protein
VSLRNAKLRISASVCDNFICGLLLLAKRYYTQQRMITENFAQLNGSFSRVPNTMMY